MRTITVGLRSAGRLFLLLVFSLIAAAFSTAPLSAAEEAQKDSPSATLKSLFELTQTNASWEVLAEYVDWGSVLKGMPDWMPEQYNLSTAEDTRDFYLTFLKDPSYSVRVRYRTKDLMANSEDEENVERLKAALTQISNDEPLKQVAKLKQVLRDALFDIGNERVSGAAAEVDLVVYSDDAMYDVRAEMRQIKGRWRLAMPKLSRFLAPAFNAIDSDAAYEEISKLKREKSNRQRAANIVNAQENGIKAELDFVAVSGVGGKPLSGARVQWLQPDGKKVDALPDGVTDEDGRFHAVAPKWYSKQVSWKVSCDGFDDKLGRHSFISAGDTEWNSYPKGRPIHVTLRRAVSKDELSPPEQPSSSPAVVSTQAPKPLDRGVREAPEKVILAKAGNAVLSKVTGACEVTGPNDAAPSHGVEGKELPLGSKIATDRKSSAVLRLPGANECSLARGTVLVMGPDPRVVSLQKGQVDIVAKQAGITIVPEGSGVSCSPEEGRLSVKAEGQQNMIQSVISCAAGKASVDGFFYSIPSMASGAEIATFYAETSMFQRMKVVKGSFDVEISVPEDNTRVLNVSSGDILKVWAKRKSKGSSELVVTILCAKPDGSVLPPITFTTKEVD